MDHQKKHVMGKLRSGSHNRLPESASTPLWDLILAQMKELLPSEMRCVWEDCGDSNSLVLERVVKKEVVGKMWVELMRMEMDNLWNEIEDKLLEELVEEAVVDLTVRALGVSTFCISLSLFNSIYVFHNQRLALLT